MGLFSKKSKSLKTVDKIFMSNEAKLAAMADLARNEPVIFVFWFDQSMRDAEENFRLINIKADLFHAREITSHHLAGRKIFFAEHYPLKSKELVLFEKLHLQQAIVYSSLTEPIFKVFGGENIISLMKKLGLEENSSVEHPMISKAIANAQEKLEKKILMDQSASSVEQWFKKASG